MNEGGEYVIMHTGLQGIDIIHLEDYANADNRLPDDDLFADLPSCQPTNRTSTKWSGLEDQRYK